ncbi:glycosyltransferase [Rheinheimera sp. FR7-31]|uniref:glycosyltransferase family 2 protein n=1 Tax=Rheinheimera fenheensis TaxID=3152295 RepID=UPI00325E754B
MQPLVSILIPVYNHAQYIEECLNAIPGLSYPNIEVLICDDGSKDSSYIIAENWVKRNPQIRAKLFSQENQGVCKTLNRLISESSGQYITLCASDDVLAKDGIAQRVKLLEADSTKLACIGDATVINEHSVVTAQSAMKTLYSASYDLLQTDIVRELVLRWSVVGPTLLIRKSAYFNLGFYDSDLLVEDREFFLRLLSKESLLFYPCSVAAYRIHSNNASRKSYSSRLKILQQVAISNLKHYQSFNGFLRFFLMSHKVDMLFFRLPPLPAFVCTLPWRLFRKMLVKVWLRAGL